MDKVDIGYGVLVILQFCANAKPLLYIPDKTMIGLIEYQAYEQAP
jgi:hypothetical protein